MSYKIAFKTKWSDFDANKHMRHTAYNDYAAEARLRFLEQYGFGLSVMEKQNIGPILFSESTVFNREIRLGEDILVALFLKASSKNGERFKLKSCLLTKDGTLAATITVFLAWIDLTKRKLATPSKEIITTLQHLKKTADFKEIILKK